MATPQDQLIQVIRRIAKSDPEIRSLLTVLQKRGALDGFVKLVGGSDAAALEDCCTKDDDADPEEGDPEDISEDAPPEVPDIGDEDGDGESEWSDCETGDPITFAPGGFPQPETCKDCERPDDTWEQGFWWRSTAVFSASGVSPADVYAKLPYDIGGGGTPTTKCGLVQESPGRWRANYKTSASQCGNSYIPIDNESCVSDYIAEFCDITEPPTIDDCQDWESDNTTSYTLANGCIVASTCDPDASAAAQACNECITICNADGQERRICSIGNGQWILYDPSGKYKGGRYDATGKRIEILPAGETGGYLPSEAYDGSYDGGTIGGGDGWVWS